MCRKDQIQVSHVEKNIVEQSSTIPKYLNHTLGLTLSTPSLVNIILNLIISTMKVSICIIP